MASPLCIEAQPDAINAAPRIANQLVFMVSPSKHP
jgi:hypothetical protein